MKKQAIFLILAMLFTKIFGIGREMILSFYYGATAYSDVYIISSSIPITVIGIVASGITTSFIPVYNKVKNSYSEEEANNYTSNLLNILLVLSLIVAVVSFVFSEQVVRMFASGFNGETLALAVQFTKYTIWSMIFTVLISIITGFLQIKQKFLIPTFMSLLGNIITIISILLSNKLDYPLIMAMGVVVSAALQFIIMFFIQNRLDYKHKMILEPNNEHIKYMLYISVPIIIGTSIDQVNAIIDKSIASSVLEGGVSILSYASKISDSILNMFVTSIATVLFPSISEIAASGDFERVQKMFSKSINYIAIIIIPAVFGIVIYAEQIVSIFYGRGAFGQEALALTTGALIFYSIGTYAFGLRQIATRVFYAIHDTKTPVISAAVAVVFNIVLNLILSRFMGISGLALATSISAYISIVLLFILMRRKIGNLDFKNTLIVNVKVLVISAIMAFVSWQSFMFLRQSMSELVSLAIAIGIAVVVYAVLILFSNIDEVKDIKEKLLSKFRRSKV